VATITQPGIAELKSDDHHSALMTITALLPLHRRTMAAVLIEVPPK
jgi:hypothetical protein